MPYFFFHYSNDRSGFPRTQLTSSALQLSNTYLENTLSDHDQVTVLGMVCGSSELSEKLNSLFFDQAHANVVIFACLMKNWASFIVIQSPIRTFNNADSRTFPYCISLPPESPEFITACTGQLAENSATTTTLFFLLSLREDTMRRCQVQLQMQAYRKRQWSYMRSIMTDLIQ